MTLVPNTEEDADGAYNPVATITLSSTTLSFNTWDDDGLTYNLSVTNWDFDKGSYFRVSYMLPESNTAFTSADQY